MNNPIQVVFRNMERSDRIEKIINERAEKLNRFYDRITSLRVTVELPHRHHKQGNSFQVSIDMVVPDKEIVVTRDTNGHGDSHEAIAAAVREAFDAARRQLEDYARKRRGEVKSHDGVPSGKISQIFEDYGFVETIDGREIYFHSNSLVNERFDRLEVGTEVTFVERQGNEGPMASTVRLK
ncbi:MAG: HPF/RaiA family ribosome-associated protein [Candidatus Melainabacteria bacterium]|nr:HPF/RaiA family ribosome-associated protein [Candidatus Melainabacteria bacterium]